MSEAAPKMCQTCWVTPAKHVVRGSNGIKRWKCNTCFNKAHPNRAATGREMLERKIFSKINN